MLLQQNQYAFSSSTCWQREGRREKGGMEGTDGGVLQPWMGDGQHLPHQHIEEEQPHVPAPSLMPHTLSLGLGLGRLLTDAHSFPCAS